MRAVLIAVAVLAAGACTPEVTPGAYLCGPEQLCPEGQACNGPDAVCVLESAALPFACDPDGTEAEPNDDQATAQVLFPAPMCTTPVLDVVACSPEGDAVDWFAVTSADNCTAVVVDARLVFSSAFEVLDLTLVDAAGAELATGAPCANDPDGDGDTRRCLRAPLTPGATYALRVRPTADGACDGACAYNRYTLSARLDQP